MSQVKDFETTIIDGISYKIQLLSTSRAFITGQQLLKLGLPSAGAAVDGMVFADEFSDNQTWQAVAIHMVRQFDDVDILEIIKELLQTLEVDGTPVDFDSYFRGRLDLLISVIEFALKENYGSLFTGSSLMKKLLQYMKEYQARSSGMEETQEVETELPK